MKEEKTELKKGDGVYIVSGFAILKGIFISKGLQWNYVENEDGTVLGYSDKVTFPKKELALEYLVELLKTDILYKAKDIVEKLPLPVIAELNEMIEALDETNKIIKKLK